MILTTTTITLIKIMTMEMIIQTMIGGQMSMTALIMKTKTIMI